MVKKSHHYSSLLLHKMELATLKAFRLYPSNKILFTASLVILVKVSSSVLWPPPLRPLPYLLFPFHAPIFWGWCHLWRECCLDSEVLILETEMRGRDYPTECAKICIHKLLNKSNLHCISKNSGTISNIFYKRTNVKSFDSIFVFRSWFSTWKSRSLTWKSDLRDRGHSLSACSLLPAPSYASSLLKENVLTWKFNLSGSMSHLCACSLLLGSSDVSFSLKEKVLTRSVALQGRGHVYMLVLFT